MRNLALFFAEERAGEGRRYRANSARSSAKTTRDRKGRRHISRARRVAIPPGNYDYPFPRGLREKLQLS
jgi:hypothetical protein